MKTRFTVMQPESAWNRLSSDFAQFPQCGLTPQTCGSPRGLSEQAGSATLIAVLVVALLGMFVAASLSRVTTGATLAGNDSGNSSAFYAAQASLELMSLNFSNIFAKKLTPSQNDLNGVQSTAPSIPGFTFNQVVTQLPPPNPPNTVVQSGPFAGLTSIRTTYQLDAVATLGNTQQVHLTRSFYNHQIPIFQFGIFYNGDLTMYPGPNMYFSGRVHSNANIYMLAGSAIYFANRVTAGGEIIRDWNRNGFPATGNVVTGASWTGSVNVTDGTTDVNGNVVYQTLQMTSGGKYFGSALPAGGTSGTAPNLAPGWSPNGTSFTNWLNGANSAPLFKGNLLANQPQLLLPFAVGTGRSDIELIKRGITANDYQSTVLGQAADDGILGPSRYTNKPGIRVSLSDSQGELPGGTGGIRLDGDSTGTNLSDTDADGSRGYKPTAMTDGYQAARINGLRLYTGPNYSDNGTSGAGAGITANRQTWIKVEIVSQDANNNIITTDVTKDFLSCGMTDVAPDLYTVDANGNYVLDVNGNKIPIGDSRAILKLQHYEIQGPPVRVADVNVADQTAPNTTNAALSIASDSYPTTANYVYSPLAGKQIAVGPYSAYTYQPKNGTLNNAFNYVSMSQNNYSPTMAGDPTNTTLNGYSVFTNLHQSAAPSLYIPSASLSSTIGSNIWTTPTAPGTNSGTVGPVSIGGSVSAPAAATYPSTPSSSAQYVFNTRLVPPSWIFTITNGAGGTHTFKLTVGALGTTGAITFNSGSIGSVNATSIQTAIAALATVGAGNVLVTSTSGAVASQIFNVYLSNPALVVPGGLTPNTLVGVTATPLNGAGAPSAFINETWQVSLQAPVAKTFKMTFGGATTTLGGGAGNTIAYNPAVPATTAANISAALTALGSIGVGGSVNVSPSNLAGSTTQTFTISITSAPTSTLAAANNALTLNTIQAGLAVTPSCPTTIGGLTTSATPAWSSASSIEAAAFGLAAGIPATANRVETVVPFPIEIFDPREGIFNASMNATGANSWDTFYPNGATDGNASAWRGANVPAVGVMSMLDIDVANLKAFLNGTAPFATTVMPFGTNSASIPNNGGGGWILYVSDRRGDRDDDGEYDMEDIYGPQDGNQDPGEDQNVNGRLDVDPQWESALILGNNGPLANNIAGWNTNPGAFPGSWTIKNGANFPSTVSLPNDLAAVFDHAYFRRGVRLINGSQLPGNINEGFTVATENPAYVLGNFNAQGVAAGPDASNHPTPPNSYIPSDGQALAGYVQSPSSIVADGITVLSTAWKDGNSFRNPYNNNAGNAQLAGQPSGLRNATMTTVRAAFLMGSSIASLQKSYGGTGVVANCQGGNDLCLDGGVHNFPRFLENWGNGNVCPTNVPAGVPTNIANGGTLFNYTGSLINPFASRQAVGAYKNGGGSFVYSPPVRNWSFDVSFLSNNRLPPGTPFFQFIQMTGFRQTVVEAKTGFLN